MPLTLSVALRVGVCKTTTRREGGREKGGSCIESAKRLMEMKGHKKRKRGGGKRGREGGNEKEKEM
jgi:hypothetical protein